jgi:ADP-heptose:LPS heptosyltransferase
MTDPSPPKVTTEAQREAAARLEEFRKLRERGALCTSVTEQLATEAATRFLDGYRDSGEYLGDAITLLSEIATLEELCLSEPGQRATFPLLVERLSDSFDPGLCVIYDRVFAQMISLARTLPQGQKLDAALRRFHLLSEQDILERKRKLRRQTPWLDPGQQRAVRKVLVLSRVTLGADVAITSVVLQKAKSLFPDAQVSLLAPPRARQLFGGDSSLHFCDITYRTDGTLLERLEDWLEVVAAVERETRGLRPQEYVLLDPDSRLLQLGMLPAGAEESRYFFFESRRYGASEPGSVSELTLRWLNATFGGDEQILPKVCLHASDLEFGRAAGRCLRQGAAKALVAVSFGVGGNMDKRLPDPFEERLLLQLLQEGCAVMLDKGSGEEELSRAQRLLAPARLGGWALAEMDSANASAFLRADDAASCRLLTWQGGIGAWAGLVAASDQYIGYDSAGQHIAAALGVPTIDIFTAHATPIFRQRWRPTGRGVVKVVAEGDETGASSALESTLREVIRLHREISERQ